MKRNLHFTLTLTLLLSLLLPACRADKNPLPHALYYLDGRTDAQVWRLETDSLTRTQITHEEAGVAEFSVSPADGSLALITDNQLFILDAEGENRRLVADDRNVDKNAEDYVFRGFISSPVFSPDGQTLAYAFDGLHLYDVATGEDEHVLTNLGNLMGEIFVFSKENYYPASWSPDGTKLLISMGYYEGSTLAVMERGAAQPFTRLRSDGPVCCQFVWTPDSRSVLVANPDFSTTLPGLWRFDAETGVETVLVPGIAEDGSTNYAGWPHGLPSGKLLYFQVNLARFNPEVGIPLQMVRRNPDGSSQSLLRPEEFRIIQALWAPDGSLVLIVRMTPEKSMQVVLARRDGSPLQVLFESGRISRLAWGP